MKRYLSRLLESSVFRIAVLLIACLAMVAFGIIGVGRKGEGGFDMAFLYVAGRTWLQGLNAYELAAREQSVGALAKDIYAFAYPPQVFPLSALLAMFSFEKARILMTIINVLCALALALLCVKLVKRGESKILNDSGVASQWFIPAIILGVPFTAHVLWMGQTSLVVITALAWGWYFAKYDHWLVSGILLAITTIKPQISLFVFIWLALERRWRPLAVASVLTLIFCLGPMVITGPIQVFLSWLADVKVYKASPFNSLGFQHIVSIQNIFYVSGIKSPSLIPVGIILSIMLWWQRSKILSDDVLALLICLAFLFGSAHDYDLIALALLVPSFWRHLRGRGETTIIIALIALAGMFFPQRLLNPLNSPVLLQYRVFILIGLAVWLLVMSIKRAKESWAPQIDDSLKTM